LTYDFTFLLWFNKPNNVLQRHFHPSFNFSGIYHELHHSSLKKIPAAEIYLKRLYLQHCSKYLELQKQQTIKKISAFVLLFLLIVSITPTIVFHNWFVEHTDTVSKSFENGREQLGKKTFHCQCDHVVAESPFTEINGIICNILQPAYQIPGANGVFHVVAATQIIYRHRGPPVA
jgi:hypothetical protein